MDTSSTIIVLIAIFAVLALSTPPDPKRTSQAKMAFIAAIGVLITAAFIVALP